SGLEIAGDEVSQHRWERRGVPDDRVPDLMIRAKRRRNRRMVTIGVFELRFRHLTNSCVPRIEAVEAGMKTMEAGRSPPGAFIQKREDCLERFGIGGCAEGLKRIENQIGTWACWIFEKAQESPPALFRVWHDRR